MADFLFKRGTTFLVTLIAQDSTGMPVDLGRVRVAADLRDNQNTSLVPRDVPVVTPRTVTYTPKAAGTVSISATNSGGLTNPAGLSVVVSAAG